MDKIARIRQEIERRMKIYKESNYGISLRYQELEELLSFLDTLSEEPVQKFNTDKLQEIAKPATPHKKPTPEDRAKFMEELHEYAESKKPDKSLEEAIMEYYGNIPDDKDKVDAARHFAEWGAEHLRDSTKIIDKSLEEAAEEYSKRVSDGHNYRDLTCGFIAGAEWMKEQMLKEAYNYSDLYSWYIHNVSVYDKPLWSEKHLKELLKDFIVIPIEDSENGSK